MNKRYRVVFLGLIDQREDFKRSMSGLGVPSETVDEIIQKAPVILKRDMTLAEARQYADAVQIAGGKVNIQDDGVLENMEPIGKPIDIKPLDHFTMCPECGYKQLKTQMCKKCGFLFNRTEIQRE
jgi:predicted Zn-ribbon and HTH transcriptional regulator